jgi:hypothetical protein
MQAFAAGADIKEMQNRDFASNYRENFLGKLLRLAELRFFLRSAGLLEIYKEKLQVLGLIDFFLFVFFPLDVYRTAARN